MMEILIQSFLILLDLYLGVKVRQAITFLEFGLYDLTNEATYEKGYSTWNGYRLTATDGSKVQLPFDEKLHEKFGTVGRNSTANTAQASILFDVL
ncbi:MAG: hypothetical protein LBT47_14410, partial [Deltaproteobacteria bacterium]|nr:hypothetical protein [Deltaproteobacteria bacterium]